MYYLGLLAASYRPHIPTHCCPKPSTKLARLFGLSTVVMRPAPNWFREIATAFVKYSRSGCKDVLHVEEATSTIAVLFLGPDWCALAK